MNSTVFNRTTHFSIIWGLTLAVLTLVEWRSLDREPLKQQIMSPFIERHIEVSLNRADDSAVSRPAVELEDAPGTSPEALLRYDVELSFRGPLFLICFFAPIALFHGVALLWRRKPHR